MSHSQTAQAGQLPLVLSEPSTPAESLTLDQLTLAELRYLHGPIVQPRFSGWDIPDRLRALVPLARWWQIVQGRAADGERDLASEEEAIGYLSCASLEAPLSHDWAEIFFYLSQQVFPRWGLVTGEAVPEALGLSQPVTLNSQQVVDLRRFRRWLRRRVEDGAKRQRSRHSSS